MQFITTGLLIIAFIVLLLIFFSCNKKGTKTLEPFVNEMRLAEFILPNDTLRSDLEITSKEMDIKEKEDDIYSLLIAISNIEMAIRNKQAQLDQLRLDYDNLNLEFDNILRLINELNQYIASFVNTDTPYVQDINVFDLQLVRDRRNTIASDIDSIKDRLASQLVHYGQEDISSVEKINSTIASFNEIKQTYNVRIQTDD